jgi:hypothetical protein
MMESRGGGEGGENPEHINPYDSNPLQPPEFSTPRQQAEITVPGDGDGGDEPHEATPAPPQLERAEDLLTFIVPHDGTQAEVSVAEAQTVTRKYDSLFDDLMLTHMEGVEHIEAVPHAGNTLHLQVPAAEGWNIHIHLNMPDALPDTTSSVSPSQQVVRWIGVQAQQHYKGGTSYVYHRYADGIVRRFTMTPAENAQNTALSKTIPRRPATDAPAEQKDAYLAKFGEVLQNARDNDELAQAIGMQNQPIGVAEMDGLAGLLGRPDIAIAPPPSWRRARPPRANG